MRKHTTLKLPEEHFNGRTYRRIGSTEEWRHVTHNKPGRENRAGYHQTARNSAVQTGRERYPWLIPTRVKVRRITFVMCLLGAGSWPGGWESGDWETKD